MSAAFETAALVEAMYSGPAGLVMSVDCGVRGWVELSDPREGMNAFETVWHRHSNKQSRSITKHCLVVTLGIHSPCWNIGAELGGRDSQCSFYAAAHYYSTSLLLKSLSHAQTLGKRGTQEGLSELRWGLGEEIGVGLGRSFRSRTNALRIGKVVVANAVEAR